MIGELRVGVQLRDVAVCYEESEFVNCPGPDAAKTFSRGEQGERHVTGVGGVCDDVTGSAETASKHRHPGWMEKKS